MGREIEIKNTNEFKSNLKKLLEFYDALGFEMLPLKITNIKTLIPINIDNNMLSPEEKGKALILLREEIDDCKRCKLYLQRTNIVFGEGNPNARLMFIGEAPGREEDLKARPFVGDAGMLLTRLIKKMGFKRSDVYIANIVKCRPPMNRDPEIDEIETCKQFLYKQIDIIKPEVIMALGRISVGTLLNNMKIKITAIRGNFFDFKGIPVMPTFHPAYLIRNPKDKWLTWDDAKKVLKRLGLDKNLNTGELI
jgi:DNA polymerase